MIIMSVRRTFFDRNISASIISIMCTYMYTTIPLLIIHFNMQHYMWSFPLLFFYFCYFSLPLSSHLLPIVLYVPYIFIIFHQHSFDVQLYISSSCWLLSLSLTAAQLDRQSEWDMQKKRQQKNSWNRKEDRKEAKKKKDNSFMYGQIHFLQLRFDLS